MAISRYIAAAWLLSAAAPAAATPPLSAYGQLPGIRLIAVSPDGARFAAIVGDASQAQLQVRDLTTRKLLAMSQADAAKVRGLQWVGPDHLLATTSTTAAAMGVTGPRREWSTIADLDLVSGKWRRLLEGIEGAMNVMSGAATGLIIAGKPVVIVPGYTFAGGTGVSTLFRVPLGRGDTSIIETGNSDTNDWVIGPAGEPVARADYNRKSGDWRLLVRAPGGSWKRAYTETAPIDAPYIRALGSNGDTVLVSTETSGVRQVHDVGIADGSWSPPRPDLDTDGLITDPVSHRAIGTFDASLDSYTYRFFADSDQKLWRGLTKAFPGELVSLADWSDDRNVIIVEVEGQKNGDSFYVVDRRKGSAEWLTDHYPGVTPDDIAPVTTLTYKAGDGRDIPAYLTLPRGRTAKGLPLVVLAHGGPESRDSPGFDWWAQALASRGYAVLQPQFRGSSGFGAEHRDAGYGQWGRKMQTDLSDGVRQLAKDGTINPARVCIVGASYGGYAALAGPTLDPGVYRCASSIAGVADLRRMLAAEISDANGSSKDVSLRYWRRFMGVDNDKAPLLDTLSPAKLAERVTVPIQLIHGKDDTVVRYEQSQIMEKALRAAGKPVEFVTLVGEDHWLSRPETRITMLHSLVAFLEKHNPPTPAEATAAAP